MYRTIITPAKSMLTIQLPDEFIGRQIEILAFTIDDKIRKKDKRYSWKNAKKFFDAHRVNLSKFKFNRDEANER